MADGFALFPDRSVVAMRVNGELKDLATTVTDDDVVEPVTIDSPDGLSILRHSAAHVLAQAVQRINPQANLGIGPPITDGFYYDFGVAEPFTPEDAQGASTRRWRASSARGSASCAASSPTTRRAPSSRTSPSSSSSSASRAGPVTAREAATTASRSRSAPASSRSTTTSTRDGETVWKDLCRGPHLPNTRMIGNGWALTRIAAAYWRGSEKNPQLQRIYGTAWPTKDELRAYQQRLEEAAKRDHRKLGRELDLFSFPDEIGSGLSVWHPRGGIVRKEMEQHARRRHIAGGYTYVYTPHISKQDLFLQSNHLVTYKEGMFPPIHMDEERDAEGEITKQGVDYYLKPMNCPMHILIYKERARSYRDLPMRLAENGTVYRNELSGALHGLTRVRGFTQDDSHLFVTPEQLEGETTEVSSSSSRCCATSASSDFELELSMRDDEKDKWIGSRGVLGLLDRTRCATSPSRAGSSSPRCPARPRSTARRSTSRPRTRSGAPGSCRPCRSTPTCPSASTSSSPIATAQKKRPIMIHRALFGSIERFFAILLEHYAGAFPVWLVARAGRRHPRRRGVRRLPRRGHRAARGARACGPSSTTATTACRRRSARTRRRRFRSSSSRGSRTAPAAPCSFRFRDGTQENGVPIDDAVRRIRDAIRRTAPGDTRPRTLA